MPTGFVSVSLPTTVLPVAVSRGSAAPGEDKKRFERIQRPASRDCLSAGLRADSSGFGWLLALLGTRMLLRAPGCLQADSSKPGWSLKVSSQGFIHPFTLLRMSNHHLGCPVSHPSDLFWEDHGTTGDWVYSQNPSCNTRLGTLNYIILDVILLTKKNIPPHDSCCHLPILRENVQSK